MSYDKSEKYAIVKAYHEQTKHHLDHYARSLGYMDWDNQPKPFRLFEGAPQIQLPLISKDRGLPYSALYEPVDHPPYLISLESIACMLELGMGLSAWKKFGNSEWALRMNPSSGNLHPTECYLVLPELHQQQACITHYLPYQHALEERALLDQKQALWLKNSGGFGIILTSIPWREAWKYGERAFRYCHHDLGHALGALRFACNLNGWKMTVIPQVGEKTLDKFLGFEQLTWIEGEQEHADCLCWVERESNDLQDISQWFNCQENFNGDNFNFDKFNNEYQPNRLSLEHVDWEIISMVQRASQLENQLEKQQQKQQVKQRKQQGDASVYLKTINHSNVQHSKDNSALTAEEIIRKRRSAQNYDQTGSRIELSTFIHSLEQTLPGKGCPFDAFPFEPQVHLALFVHAVEGLESGLYMFVRNPSHLKFLKSHTHSSFDWIQIKEDLPLYLLETGDFRAKAKLICCDQAIAGNSAFSLGMLSRFESVLMQEPAMYPRLFWETGLIGQVLYLEAEAHQLRATGIGCFFDDQMHTILGLKDCEWQILYHFTVGKHVDDDRLEIKTPYFHLI